MIENEYHIHEYQTGRATEKLEIGEHYLPFIDLFKQKHSFKAAYAKVFVDDYLNGGLLALVIAEDGNHNSVGYGFIRRPDNINLGIVEFAEAFVLADVRRQGVYKDMLQARIEIAIEMGLNSIIIYVDDDENPLGKYLRMIGFKKSGTMDHLDRLVKRI